VNHMFRLFPLGLFMAFTCVFAVIVLAVMGAYATPSFPYFASLTDAGHQRFTYEIIGIFTNTVIFTGVLGTVIAFIGAVTQGTALFQEPTSPQGPEEVGLFEAIRTANQYSPGPYPPMPKTSWNCKNCGGPNPRNAQFCGYCGKGVT